VVSAAFWLMTASRGPELEVGADLLADFVQHGHLRGRDAHPLPQLLLVVLEDVVLAAQLLDQLAVEHAQPAVRAARS
jgi:hypothetical protein